MKKQLIFTLLCSLSFVFGNAQTPITATIGYQGYDETQAYFGEAEYQIFMDNTTNVLDKPIILIDGFDPGDTRDINGMYALLDYNGNNIADELRDEGFDFVLLNFPIYTRASDNVEVDGGSDYIQRNAMILAELISQINAQKTGNEELVVIGPSMGGLISRYALKYMEDNSLAHQTRLFISWDSPHKGANLPISIQYLMNYLAEANGGNADLQASVEATLNNPASKEMLIDHYLGHLQNGSAYEQDASSLLPEGAPNFRDAFQTELDALGFPQQTRNIAVANGSGIGAMTGSPGMVVLDNVFNIPNSGGSTVDIELHFAPVAGQTIEVEKTTIDIPIFADIVYSYNATSFGYTDGVDSAPGGKYNMQSFLGGTSGNQLLTDLINALQQSEFCFIPTISAMAIANENDWYQSLDIGNTHTSPFVAYHIPDVNEDHVTPTQANVDFILLEIRNTPASIADEILANKYLLRTNPVTDTVNIVSQNTGSSTNATISIFSLAGQRLLQKPMDTNSSLVSIPIQLNNGIYFLEIVDDETTYVKKFIVSK